MKVTVYRRIYSWCVDNTALHVTEQALSTPEPSSETAEITS